MGASTSSESDPVLKNPPKCICIPPALKEAKGAQTMDTKSGGRGHKSGGSGQKRGRKGSAGDEADPDPNANAKQESEATEKVSSAIKSDSFASRKPKTMALDDSDLRVKLATLSISENAESNEIQYLSLTNRLPKNILYYAWFFSTETTNVIQEIADAYLMECLKVPHFERFLNDACLKHGIKDPAMLYRHPRKQKLKDKFKHHVTAKFIGGEEHEEYACLVQEFIGQTFRLPLVGLFFTSETFGIRVDLTEGQKVLFDERDGGPISSTRSLPPTMGSSFLRTATSIKKETAAEILKKINIVKNELANPAPLPKRNGKCKSPLHDKFLNHPEVSLLPCPDSLDHPPNSRAHITVGCVPKVLPVKAGADLRDIVDLESRGTTKFQDFKIHGGTLRQFGHGRFDEGDAFVVYAQHKILVDGVFQYSSM